MGLSSQLGSVLFFLGLYGICSGSVQGELSHIVFSQNYMNATRALRLFKTDLCVTY